MPLSFKRTIIIFSTLLSQIMLAGGDEVLVLCFGEDGHLAIESAHSDCPYGPYNKHGHPENIDVTAETQDSDVSAKTGCFDLPISRDEVQQLFSGFEFTPPPQQCVLSEIRPIESRQEHRTDRVSARLINKAKVYRVLKTVILLL